MPPRINRKYTNNKGDPTTINPFGRGFVMAALNINSLLAHLDDLNFFVLDSKIDVLAINETKIDSSVNDNEIYCFFRGHGNESCNLIGSLSGQYFLISAHGPR